MVRPKIIPENTIHRKNDSSIKAGGFDKVCSLSGKRIELYFFPLQRSLQKIGPDWGREAVWDSRLI